MSISLSEARSLIRKAKRRVPEGESITHLNITPMMDMMTILLVFMIKSMATQTSTLNMGEVALPPSTTRQAPPEEAVSVVVARNVILVEGEPVANVINGDVDASAKSQGSLGIEITKLRNELDGHRRRIEKIAAAQGHEPTKELTIVADRDTPYRLLSAVMYTAGSAKFKQYRLIVLRTEE
jgi:biopolymer transport protein ExbD